MLKYQTLSPQDLGLDSKLLATVAASAASRPLPASPAFPHLPAGSNPSRQQNVQIPHVRQMMCRRAAEPPTLVAELRGSAGTIASTKLRRGGKTPGIVFSGPGGEQQLLAFETKSLARLVAKLGRTAWACSVFNLQIEGEGGSSQTVRALVRSAFIPSCTPAFLPRSLLCAVAVLLIIPADLVGLALSAVHAACPSVYCAADFQPFSLRWMLAAGRQGHLHAASCGGGSANVPAAACCPLYGCRGGKCICRQTQTQLRM